MLRDGGLCGIMTFQQFLWGRHSREQARGNGEVRNVSQVKSLDVSDTVCCSSAFHSDTKLYVPTGKKRLCHIIDVYNHR